jgi:hypothetical protein
MNPETKKTLAFAGTALGLILLTALTGLRPPAAQVFSPVGTPFFPDFEDPLKATALQVVEFDEALGAAKPFKVELAGGRWIIPSHHSYPADAKERLAKTATSVIGLKRDQLASETEKDHEALGVVDPLAGPDLGVKGRGKRVEFLAGSASLAQFIFGKDAGDGKKYVRVPGQKTTFVARTPGEISGKFEDWVETDLLQLSSGAVRRVVIDKYSFDEQAGQIKDRNVQTLSREDSSKPWTLSELKETEEVHTDNVSTLVSTLDDLKLAGVRPKPSLIAKIKDLEELKKFNRPQLMAAFQDLAGRGFFISRDLSLISNEGEMAAHCEDGIVYTLRFGEILMGAGDAVSAGAEPPKDGKKDEKAGGKEHRYLFVTVRFDESLLAAVPPAPAEYKADPAKKPEEQKAEEEKAKQAKEEWERKKKDHDQKVDEGKQRVEKLQNRFAEWYYVISGESFKKLRLDRAGLVKPKEKKEEPKKEEPKKDDGHQHDEKDGKKEEPKKPSDAKPEEKKPEEKKPEEKKTEAPKPPEKSGEPVKPGEKPPEKKAEEPKPAPPKPEEKKP